MNCGSDEPCCQLVQALPFSPNYAIVPSMTKRLEQGISDFKEFITERCYFVDKTHLITHLIEHPSKVHLITRPRRFGKTLNLSMVRYFFEAPVPGEGDVGTSHAALFDGLSVTRPSPLRRIHGAVSGYSFELQKCERKYVQGSHVLNKVHARG